MHIIASLLQSPEAVIFKGKKLNVSANITVNTVTSTSSTEGSFSDKTSSFMQETPSLAYAVIQAPIIDVQTQEAEFNGVLAEGDRLLDRTATGITCAPKIGIVRNRQEMTVKQPFSSMNAGTEGWQEVMAPTILRLKEIVRVCKESPDRVKIKLISVDWDKEATRIQGEYEEIFYQLKCRQNSWCNKTQLIPDEALVVVALGIAIATQGVGVEFLAPMLEEITAVTGMQLSAMGCHGQCWIYHLVHSGCDLLLAHGRPHCNRKKSLF